MVNWRTSRRHYLDAGVGGTPNEAGHPGTVPDRDPRYNLGYASLWPASTDGPMRYSFCIRRYTMAIVSLPRFHARLPPTLVSALLRSPRWPFCACARRSCALTVLLTAARA